MTITFVLDNGDGTYTVDFSETVTATATPGDNEPAFISGDGTTDWSAVHFVTQTGGSQLTYATAGPGRPLWLTIFQPIGFVADSGNPFDWANVENPTV